MTTSAIVTRDSILAQIKSEFRLRDPNYDSRRASAHARRERLRRQFDPLQRPVSQQVHDEAQWLINYCDDWDRVAATLDFLEQSLTSDQPPPRQQADGSWGEGCTFWYRKLEPTVAALESQAIFEQDDLQPLVFMQRLQDPKFVLPYLESLRESSIRLTGRNNRDEHGSVLSALCRLIFKRQVRQLLQDNQDALRFEVSTELEKAFTEYLWDIQNAETGYWGPRYVFGNVSSVEVQDLSFTFHIVRKYTRGTGRRPPNMDKLATTTLAIENEQFPNGWQASSQPGAKSNRINFFVASLLRQGWPDLTNDLRAQAKARLQDQLTWCLTDTLMDGTFASVPPGPSVEAYRDGVRFLQEIGFWGDGTPWEPLELPSGHPSPERTARKLLQMFITDGDDGSSHADDTRQILIDASSREPDSAARLDTPNLLAMQDPDALRLQDLEPFAPLGEIAKEFDVDITLFGGTASRAAMSMAYGAGAPLDLFDLAPFTSDIDLEHSGDASITNELLTAIEESVPFASWFRWSINDRERARKSAASRAVSTRVPLRDLRISTTALSQIPSEAIRDLRRRTVSFQRNTRFRSSHLAAETLDVEVFGLMMVLNVYADMDEIAGEIARTDDFATIENWLSSAAMGDLSLAASRPRLAARFWHLLANRLAHAGPDTINQRLLEVARASGVLDSLRIDAGDLGTSRALSVSKFTSTGGFRVPELTPSIVTGADAESELLRLVESAAQRARIADPPSARTLDGLIDPAFELVAVVPELPLSRTGSTVDVELDSVDAHFSGSEQDFVEIAWNHSGDVKLNPHGLTAQLMPMENLTQLLTTSALPAVGGVFAGHRPWVRARFDDLMERRPNSEEKVALFVLQVRDE